MAEAEEFGKPDLPPSPATPQQSPEETHEEKLAEHANERVDPAWADDFSADLRQQVNALAEAGNFVLRGVDCRSSACSVEVEWKSYNEAAARYGKFFGGLQTPCAKEILLPDPVEPTGPYRATAVLTGCRGKR